MVKADRNIFEILPEMPNGVFINGIFHEGKLNEDGNFLTKSELESKEFTEEQRITVRYHVALQMKEQFGHRYRRGELPWMTQAIADYEELQNQYTASGKRRIRLT